MKIHQNNKKYKKWTKIQSIIEKFRIGFHASPGDIVWVSIGMNIGSEICGHDNDWKRPMLILKRFGDLYIVLPMTTKGLSRYRGRWVIKTYHHKINSINFGKDSFIILHQIRTIDKKRFFRRAKDKNKKYAKLHMNEFLEIKRKLNKILNFP